MLTQLKELYTLNKLIRYFHFNTDSGFLHEAADYIKFAGMLDTLTEVLIQTGQVDKRKLLHLESEQNVSDSKLFLIEEIERVTSSVVSEVADFRAVNKVLDDISEFLSILQYKLENLS